MDSGSVHLAAALHELTAEYEGPPEVPPVTYSRVHAAAVAGRIPARRQGGRLMVRRADYPIIADEFGLKPRPSPKRAA